MRNAKHVALVVRDENSDDGYCALRMLQHFRHLGTFTFVLRHYSLPPSDPTPKSFIEPVDVEKIISICQNQNASHAYTWAKPTGAENCQLDFVVLKDFDVKYLVNHPKEVAPFDIPRFEEKVAITLAMQDKLESWRACTKKQCKQFDDDYEEEIRERCGSEEKPIEA